MAWEFAVWLAKAAPWLLIIGGAAHVAQKQMGFVDNKVIGVPIRAVVGVASVAAGVLALTG